MDKILDQLSKAVEREQMSPRKIIASGKLDGTGSGSGKGSSKPTKAVSSLSDLKGR